VRSEERTFLKITLQKNISICSS